MINKGTKFWMVLVDGTNYTSYQHWTKESAEREAQRLLNLPEYRNRGATILEAVEYATVPETPAIFEAIT